MGGGPENAPRRRTEYKVVITGQGPFPDGRGGHYDEFQNTSHLVTRYLPTSLPVGHTMNPTSLPIRIINPTAPDGKYIPTEYAKIRQYVKRLWDEQGEDVDLIYHLGMADGWNHYTIERRAYGEGFSSEWWGQSGLKGYYHILDDVGKTIKDITDAEGKGIWKDMPLGLGPTFDVDQAIDDASRLLTTKSDPIAVVSHEEPGNYCCGFIYYESLAQRRARKMTTRVMFTHVPGWKDSARLENGAETICAVIGSVCKQIV